MRIEPSNLHRFLFLLCAFILINFATVFNVFGTLSSAIQTATLIGTISFLVLAILYLKNRQEFTKNEHRAILGLSAITLLSFFLSIAFSSPIGATMLTNALQVYELIGIYTVLIIPLIFLIFFGLFLLRKKYKKAAYALFALTIVVLAIYFASGAIFNHYKIDDEIFITFTATKALFAGHNPYNFSSSFALYSNVTMGLVNSPSITTTNQLVGTLSYPALYIFAFIPFYLISAPTMQNLTSIDMNAESAVLLIVLLISIALMVDRKYLGKPEYGMIIFIGIAVSYLSSIAIYLMLALLLVTYARLEGRYSWILLGLCASLQEQLWIPVLLMIAYTFINQGWKRSALNAVGALAIFIILNAYFIAIGPQDFFHWIFNPASSPLMPNGPSAIGYFIASQYHALLSSFPLLFGLATIGSVLLFTVLNRKRLVGIFSMVPLLFLSHSIPVYYTFFIGFTVITIFISTPKVSASGAKLVNMNRRAVYCALGALVLVGAALVYLSHLAYVSNYGILVDNQSLTYNSGGNYSIYSATIHYGKMRNYSIYIAAIGAAKYGEGYFGLLNQTIIADAPKNCTGFPCIVNTNRVDLNPLNDTYRLRAYFRPVKGYPVYALKWVIYNGEYYYVSPSQYNQSILRQVN